MIQKSGRSYALSATGARTHTFILGATAVRHKRK